MSDDDLGSRVRKLEEGQMALELEHKHFKHRVTAYVDENRSDHKTINGKADEMSKMIKSNSEKLDKIEGLVDQAKGGVKALGMILDASIIFTFVVGVYTVVAHFVKELFGRG